MLEKNVKDVRGQLISAVIDAVDAMISLTTDFLAVSPDSVVANAMAALDASAAPLRPTSTVDNPLTTLYDDFDAVRVATETLERELVNREGNFGPTMPPGPPTTLVLSENRHLQIVAFWKANEVCRKSNAYLRS